MTLKARLTAWYAIALSAALSVFAFGIWIAMRSSLYSALDETLEQHGQNLAHFAIQQIEASRPARVRTELAELAMGLPRGISIELRAADGTLLYSSVVRSYKHQHTYNQTLEANGQSYRATVFGSTEEIDETLQLLAALLLSATPLVILIAALGAYRLSHAALRPVTSIIEAARTVSIDNLSQRLAVPNTGDELQSLAETWNGVLTRLENAVSRLSQFTADASHELRTPLAIIRTTAEIASRKSRSPEAYRAALEEVVAEADRMSELVEDLLFLARCDSGSEEMPRSHLDLAPVVEDVCSSLMPLCDGKGVLLECSISPAEITGDSANLRRLALVLLDNAIKFTPPGGSVRVTLKDRELTVSDTGSGIDPAALPHIFERFYQADQSRSNRGYGLGLAQAEKIVARHRAAIAVISAPGSGSTFTVKFPSIEYTLSESTAGQSV